MTTETRPERVEQAYLILGQLQGELKQLSERMGNLEDRMGRLETRVDRLLYAVIAIGGAILVKLFFLS